MFSGSVLYNVLRGECSLVLSCGTFFEDGNVLWFFPVRRGVFSSPVLSCGMFFEEGNVLQSCPVL